MKRVCDPEELRRLGVPEPFIEVAQHYAERGAFNTPSIFYFGCLRGIGHYLYENGQTRRVEVQPWKHLIDSTLCPPDQQETQGRALLHKKDGWTALAFWDRTVDTRFKSNSCFLAQGDYTFEELLAMAVQAYPEIFKRFPFKVTQYLRGTGKASA